MNECTFETFDCIPILLAQSFENPCKVKTNAHILCTISVGKFSAFLVVVPLCFLCCASIVSDQIHVWMPL